MVGGTRFVVNADGHHRRFISWCPNSVSHRTGISDYFGSAVFVDPAVSQQEVGGVLLDPDVIGEFEQLVPAVLVALGDGLAL